MASAWRMEMPHKLQLKTLVYALDKLLLSSCHMSGTVPVQKTLVSPLDYASALAEPIFSWGREKVSMQIN